MGWFKDLGNIKTFDPTGNNFLGLGKTAGRVVGSTFPTLFAGEFFRPDPFGVPRNTGFSKAIGGAATGAAAGGATGFAVGGPWGAIFGAVLGGVGGGLASSKGVSPNYTVKGAAINTGIGVGAGVLGGGAAHLSVGAAPALSVPKVATPAFSFGSLKGLATTLGGGALLQKILTPQQLAKLDLPAAAQSAVGGLIPQNMTPATNVSSYLLPPTSSTAGAPYTPPVIIDASTVPNESPSYLWLIILAIVVGLYLYFKKKKR
jgi:hypothetical protein